MSDYEYHCIESAGKWFVADPRRYDNDPAHWYCIHLGTVSTDNLDRTLQFQKRSVVDGGLPVYVFEARNRTQVHEWMEAHQIPHAWQSTRHYYKQENAMNNRRERQIAAAQRRIAAEQERIDRLMMLPEEPEPDEDGCAVVWFQKRFSPGAPQYTYAAVRYGDRWSTTGPRSPKDYQWDELIEWIYDGDPDAQVFLATEWTAL